MRRILSKVERDSDQLCTIFSGGTSDCNWERHGCNDSETNPHRNGNLFDLGFEYSSLALCGDNETASPFADVLFLEQFLNPYG